MRINLRRNLSCHAGRISIYCSASYGWLGVLRARKWTEGNYADD